MRRLNLFFVLFIAILPPVSAAPREAKPAKKPAGPTGGVKTPGVQIPFANLKAETEIPAPTKPEWLFFSQSLFTPNLEKGNLEKIDAKTGKPGDPVAGVGKPCAGMISAFGSLWVPSCGDGSLVRLNARSMKPGPKIASGVADVPGAIAADADSVWLLTDKKTTLSRIDPDQNQVVAEMRLPTGCKNLLFAETSLWLLCPSENKVYRVDPEKNVVTKRIDVVAEPQSMVAGSGSIWVLGRKEGKIDRIDPKTNKVSKTIELNVPNADGQLALGEGFLWVTMTGFPLTRINMEEEKVMQQFYGEGGGSILTSTGAIWLSNVRQGTVWKIDPKRVIATLAE